MVEQLVKLSLRNRLLVLMAAAGLFAWGIISVRNNPIDAIPDLSENQVIVFTEWMGRSPQLMEDQVTYPRLKLTGDTTGKEYPWYLYVWDEFCIYHFRRQG